MSDLSASKTLIFRPHHVRDGVIQVLQTIVILGFVLALIAFTDEHVAGMVAKIPNSVQRRHASDRPASSPPHPLDLSKFLSHFTPCWTAFMRRQNTYSSETSSFLSDASDYGELQSWFDEKMTECDVIRILLVGKAGSGKSTLVSKVFGFDLHKARIHAFTVSSLLAMSLPGTLV